MKQKHFIYVNVLILITILMGFFLFPHDAKGAYAILRTSSDRIFITQKNTINISENDLANRVLASNAHTTISEVPTETPTHTSTTSPTLPTSPTVSTPYPPPPTKVITQAPTMVSTPTNEPTNGYERPVIVVNSYFLSQDTISPGDSFTLFITLYNAGQQYATNVVATFSPGDLMPRETGGVVAVGEIAPSNHSDFGQPFLLSSDVWGAVTSINMLVTYTDQAGTSYNATFTITLPVYHPFYSPVTPTPTPTQSPTPSIKPQLVITGYTTDITPLQPGVQFKIMITVENMGNSTAKRVTMVVGGGGSSSGDGGTQQPGGISGASGEFTNFAPIGSSNVQSLGNFSPGDIIAASQHLIVNVNTTPGAYPLKISFIYLDEQNHTFVDDQVITLLVYRQPLLEISFYQQVPALYTGQSNVLPLQVINLGRNSVILGNMHVNSMSGQFLNNTVLIGNLDPGGYFTLDATYTPEISGTVDLIVSIDYTNDFNQPQVITKTLSVEVAEQSVIETPANGSQNGSTNISSPSSETLLQKAWRFILGLIGLDSGLNSTQPSENQPIKTVSPEKQPIIVPVSPPLKGP